MRYCLSHVVSVGEGAGDAVRLGKGLARGVREMSKGPETGGSGGMRIGHVCGRKSLGLASLGGEGQACWRTGSVAA